MSDAKLRCTTNTAHRADRLRPAPFIGRKTVVQAGRIADQVAVMQAGRIVEQGRAEAVLQHPQHNCTRTLLAAVPRVAIAS